MSEIPTLNHLFRHVHPQPCVTAAEVAENAKQLDVLPSAQLMQLRNHADTALQLILGDRGAVSQILPISNVSAAVFGYCEHGVLHGRGIFVGPDSMEMYFPGQSICVHSQAFEMRDTEGRWMIAPRVSIVVQLKGDTWTRSRIIWEVRVISERQICLESILLRLKGILICVKCGAPLFLAEKFDQLFRERMDDLGMKEKSHEIIRLAISGREEDVRSLCAILLLDSLEADQLIEAWTDFAQLDKKFHLPAVVNAQCTADIKPYDKEIQWERGTLKVYIPSRLSDVELVLKKLCCDTEPDVMFQCIANFIALSYSLRTQETAWRELADKSVLQTLDMDMGF